MWAKKNQGSQSPNQQVDSKQQAMDDTKRKLQNQASSVIKVPEKDIKVVKLDKGSSALVSNSEKKTKHENVSSALMSQ